MKDLKDKRYWVYRAKCRNCKRTEQWVVEKSGMDWSSFYRVTRDSYFPSFMTHCENCATHAVFDLMAMSAHE